MMTPQDCVDRPKMRPAPRTFGHYAHNYQTVSERQKEIIWLLSTGKEHQDIAEMLGICLMTVTRHLQRAKNATGCPTTAALIGHCLRKGIIQ